MSAAARVITEHTAELRELPVFWRSAPVPPGQAPPLYLHGVPTNSDDWGTSPRPATHARPSRVRRATGRRASKHALRADRGAASPRAHLSFLARSGGLAVDLPGFGRSGKPGYLTYTIPEYEGFIESYLELLDVGRVQLVMHDWGAVGLAFAQRHPERVEKLVLIDAVPFLPGYRWHRVARLWRTPALGELAMGATTPLVVRRALPAALVESVLDHFDQGTQRAILRLYRGASPAVLERAGGELGALTMPALVLWGAADPYIPVRFARAYADTLPAAELEVLEHAGHWPWLDDASVIDRVVSFLGAG